MKARVMIELTRDEVIEHIPFAMVCEARYSHIWGTMRRKRRWAAEFTESERERCQRLFGLAYDWYLKKGVPDSVVMAGDTLALWKKLGDFCYSIA